MEHIVEMSEMLFSTIIFMISVTAIIIAVNNDINFIYHTAEADRDNTTIVQNASDDMLDTTYMGVSKNGATYYEGEVLGNRVIDEIKELDSNVNVYLENTNLNSLYVNGKRYLTYVREYSDRPLQDSIIETRTYLRTYIYTNEGEVASVRYTLKPL